MDTAATSYGKTVTRSRMETRFDVWNEVPLVPQTTGMSCWAAAAAMLVGWRERIAVDPEEVAQGIGRWQAFRDGLEPDDVQTLSRTWQLHVVESPQLTARGLRELLETHGPLWLGEASPGLHSIVIVGIHGDGSDDGTLVRVNDPWPVGRGERYTLSVRELRRNFDAATDLVGAHAQMLHSGGRGSSSRSSVRRRITTSVTTDDDTYDTYDTTDKEPDMDTFSTYGRPYARTLGTTAAGERYLSSSTLSVDPLATHGGSGENLFLRWTELPEDLEHLDVVVHLHGYQNAAATRAMLERKVELSGGDLSGRSRPTLLVVPRGRHITQQELRSNPDANPGRYTFPGLTSSQGQGLEQLIAGCLSWLAQSILGRSAEALPSIDRLIITAHSGGGTAVNALLRHHGTRRVCNPHEVQLFDATYGRHDGITAWLHARVTADRAASPAGGVRPDMTDAGGAMRVLYRTGQTTNSARAIADALRGTGNLGPASPLDPWYRVERTSRPHAVVGQSYGPLLLSDPATDLPDIAERIGSPAQRYGTPMGLFQRLGANPRGWHPDAYGLRADVSTDRPRRSAEEIDELGAEAGSTGHAMAMRAYVRAFADYADDAVNPDLRHLAAWPGINRRFSFTGDLLRDLARANHFPLPESGRVLFGLRGCAILAGGDGAFHASVDLEQDIPDHKHNKCVLGVWNLDTNQIAVFRGSTVPNERYMNNQVGNPGNESNMLLTGYHKFRIGRHAGRVDGVFREAEERVILRSRDDLVYTTSDDFHRANPGDNLHPSFEPDQQGRPYEYSSAGCLTVDGDATNHDHADNPDLHMDASDGTPGWATFRERAGLTPNTSPDAENGREFRMVLLTGREADIAANEGISGLYRLRFGSEGPAVESLQTFLVRQGHLRDADVDGVFGPTTTMAWIAYQQARDHGHADGIVTPDDARAAGFTFDPPASIGQGYRGSRGYRGRRHGYGRVAVRAFVDSNSTQQEQSDQVRLNLAASVSQAETGRRYDLLHDDSNRINFGIGSWTGTRIADLLDTYEAYATQQGLTPQMLAHFGGQSGFDAIRNTFRSNGTGATLTSAQEGQLVALGRDTDLQPAQDRHLADDLRADLDAIGSNPPWYPFIDGGMGAISEVAAHVLVHARHQSGATGFGQVINQMIQNLGGDTALGQGMVSGTITERDVLEEIRDVVVSRVQQRYRNGVRNRYNRLLQQYSGSDLSYYFFPEY